MRARVVKFVLIAIVALAFALRRDGLDKSQPYLEEADPGLVVQVKLLREGIAPDPVAHKAYLAYPTLLMRGLALMPRAQCDASAPLDEQLSVASSDFVRVRGLIAVLSALLVPLTWMLARRFLGDVGSLTATALVAVSLLHLLFSQQARPHGAHATAALAAVLAHLALVRKPNVVRLAVSSLACAFAIGCLHTGVFTLVPLAVAWWLSRRDGPRLSWRSAALAAMPAVVAVLLLYPRAPRLEDAGGTLEFGGHTLHFDKLDCSGFGTVATTLWDYEPALLIAAAIGAVLALLSWRKLRSVPRERRDELAVVLAYALPYALAIGVFGETVDRFVLPLLPFLALLVGFAVESVPPLAARIALAVVALAFPSYVCARYVAVRDAPDTFELAAAWVREHAEREPVLLSPRMTLPLFFDDASLDFVQQDPTTRKRPWISHQLEQRAQPAFASREAFGLFLAPAKLGSVAPPQSDEMVERLLAEVHPAYALIEKSKLMANFPGVDSLRAAVAQRGELVETIRGEDADACLLKPIDYQEIPDFVPRLLRARAFGPCVEIYRLSTR